MKTFDKYLEDGSIDKSPFVRKLSGPYLAKARHNLTTMSILSSRSDEKAREALSVPAEYSPDEWVVISGYYAMYMAALSVLASVGYRSKTHVATLCAMEELFVRRKHLESEYVKMLDERRVEPEDIQPLSLAQARRVTAQYDVTKKTTQALAAKTMEDAYKFVARMEQLAGAMESEKEA